MAFATWGSMGLTSSAMDAEGAILASSGDMIVKSTVGKSGGGPHGRNISYYDVNKLRGPFLCESEAERTTLYQFWRDTLHNGSAPFTGTIANNGTQTFIFNKPPKFEAIGPTVFMAQLDLTIIG